MLMTAVVTKFTLFFPQLFNSLHNATDRHLCCHKIRCHRTTKAAKKQTMLHRNTWSLGVLLECITAVHGKLLPLNN